MDYSLADVASAVRNNDNGNEFGGGAWWIIVLFLFAFMGNGFGNKSNGDPVTEAGLCNAMNFNNLENTVGRLSDLTQNQTMTLGSAISNTAKDIALGQASLQQQISNCCCTTQRAIDGVNYNNAINTANIQKTIDDRFAQMERSRLEDRISQLEQMNSQLFLAQQMTGVVKYPMSFGYNAGTNPFCHQTTTTPTTTG
jgi:hypothetical protein